jgi:hypothetical protein
LRAELVVRHPHVPACFEPACHVNRKCNVLLGVVVVV